MSLLRPRWLEDLLPPTPAGSPRLRSLKGFDPQQVPAFQDELYADDPIFWSLSGQLTAAAGFIGKIGVQVPLDDSLLVIVDEVIASVAVADVISVDVGSIAVLTDTSVVKRNRRESGRGAVFERCGLSRILDNTNATVGTQILSVQATGNTPFRFPLHYRLFGQGVGGNPEQLFVRTGNANEVVTAFMWGRMLAKGPR